MFSFLTFTFRSVGQSMASFQLLLFLGYFATAQAAIDLDCFNDYDKVFCRLEVKQCSQYTVIVDDQYNQFNCSLETCNSEQCCCSTTFDTIAGVYKVKVSEGVKELNLIAFDVLDSLKPKTPTIESVNESEGIFTIYWKTHMSEFLVKPTAEVTISKNGSQWKRVFSEITPATANGLESYQINGEILEPDTLYTVSVRSYTHYSQKFSDRSQESKFQTPSAPSSLLLWITVIIVSIFGIILIVSIYIYFVRIKKKLWDSVSEPKKPIVPVRSSQFQFYEPHHDPISPVWVKSLPSKDDDQMLPFKQREDGSMNGNSTGGSSDLCYGQTEPLEPKDDIADTINKALQERLAKHFNFSGPPHPPGPQDKIMPLFTLKKPSSGSSGIVNRSYLGSPHKSPSLTEDSSAVKFPDDSINSCKSDTVDCPDQQIPAGLFSTQKDISPAVRVDMSYQQCKADANQSPLSENSSLSSTFNGTTTATLSGLDSSFKNPDFLQMLFSSSLPSGPRHCPVVVDGYKPFPNKVQQPGGLPVENQSFDHQGLNVIQGERVLQTPQSCFIPDLNKWNGPCPPVLQMPHLTLLSSNKSGPVIVIDGYKCV